jgi:chemotaxis-related protein WspD
MIAPLPLAATAADCWNHIGVRGDRSCPELAKVVHCHNCPVFAAAGRNFLNAPAPAGYLEEWTDRLAAPPEAAATDLQSVVIFRVGEEWLALPVEVLAEVTPWRQPHRVPHRGGLLAGLVNLRGELHLCVRLAQLLGIRGDPDEAAGRLLVVVWRQQRWVFPVDAVDQVQRFSRAGLTPAPATVARSHHRFSQGVFPWEGRSIGLLDPERLFHGLEGKLR